MKAFIQKEIEFDAGHRVSSHNGKCRSPHGHRYRVVLGVSGPINDDPKSSEYGMVTDFSFLKQLLATHVHDKFDHGFIVWEKDEELTAAFNVPYMPPGGWKVVLFPFQPTAENLARWIYARLENLVWNCGMKLEDVSVWETPTSMACYPWKSE